MRNLLLIIAACFLSAQTAYPHGGTIETSTDVLTDFIASKEVFQASPADTGELINSAIARINTLCASVPSTADKETKTQQIDGKMDEVYRAGEKAWSIFSALCAQRRFREAYDYYYSDEHQADVWVAMKLSTAWYELFFNVVRYLDAMFDKENENKHLLENLSLNLLLTQVVIQMSDGCNVPEHYGVLTRQLVELNALMGNYDTARQIAIEEVAASVLYSGGTMEEAMSEAHKYCLFIQNMEKK